MGLFQNRKRIVVEPSETQRAVADISSELSRLCKVAEIIRGANEEVTKIQLILPFLKTFGWDASDPYTGDMEVSTGGHCHADIMLTRDKAVKVVIEAKRIGRYLDEHIDQLLSYFMRCHASIGILTDGVTYKFYSFDGDTEWMNVFPFAVVNIRDIQLEGRDAFLLYFRKNKFELEKLIMLGQAAHTRKKLGGEELDARDHDIRAAFQRDFPQCSSYALDELIDFANMHYHYK